MRSRVHLCVLATVAFTVGVSGQTIIPLPPPDTTGGMPLMATLKARHSSREFVSRPLSDTLLGNLLWAAFGINRHDSGKRTAPSAMDNQEIDIYVIRADGAFVYRAKKHALEKLSGADLRAKAGKQAFVTAAPVNLIYVADLARERGAEEQKTIWAAADAGFIGQNAYLFCASVGLGTVIRASFDQKEVSDALGLSKTQKPILAQTVGYVK